jgi:hypothetical protein
VWSKPAHYYRKEKTMSRQTFEDGSVLLTGEDMAITIEALINHRGAYEIECSFCKYEGDEKYCQDCTIADTDCSCSCHINPPCSKCVGSKFEVSSYLINYVHHNNGRKKWECFKANEDVFSKLKAIEDADFHISAEILSTGEVAIYVSSNHDEPDLEIEICPRNIYKQVMCKMILNFNIDEGLKSTEELRK